MRGRVWFGGIAAFGCVAAQLLACQGESSEALDAGAAASPRDLRRELRHEPLALAPVLAKPAPLPFASPVASPVLGPLMSAAPSPIALPSSPPTAGLASFRLGSSIVPMADRSGRYLLQRRDLSAFFTSRGFSLALAGGPKDARKGWGLHASLVNGREVAPLAERSRQEVVNRYLGDASTWQTGVPTFDQLAWEEVLPGVDMIVESGRDGLTYGFVLSPGAKVADLAMRWEGATAVQVGAEGAEIVTGLGALQLRGLRAYEVVGRERRALTARWVAERDQLGVAVEGWSGEHPLVIDPILSWSSLIGGADLDFGFGIAAAPDGNVVVVGSTWSTGFPVVGGFDTTLSGNEGFATKLSSTGSRLWSTFLGGSSSDSALAVASTGGDFVVTGDTTSSDFPTKDAAFAVRAGGTDAFVLRISGAGALLWSTYLGGGAFESSGGITVAPDGSIVAVGSTRSADFPTKAARDGILDGISDAFVTKFSATGALLWSSFLGGASADGASGVAIDKDGNIVVGGSSGSTDYPTTGGYDTTFGGGTDDGVVTKLDPTGALIWSTYLGGNDWDLVRGVAVSPSGEVLAVGRSASTDFPLKDAFGTDHGSAGVPVAFVTKLSSAGGLAWSSFWGAAGANEARAVAVDATGSVFVAGDTSADGLTLKLAFDGNFAGPREAIVARVSGTGSLLRSSYLGGTDVDEARALALDSAGNTFIVGSTLSPDFPGASSAATNYDVFVTKLLRPLTVGTACAVDADCDLGFCTNGVCCDRRCTAPCEACTAAKKGSGSDGTCGPVADGTDPDLRCPQVTCLDDTIYNPQVCDGAGACRATTSTTCGRYACGWLAVPCGPSFCTYLGCRSGCSTDAACAKAAWCAYSVCQDDLGNGAACERNEQCVSNFCVDGLCCDKACTGACESCLAFYTGRSGGTCAPVLAGLNPRSACVADPGYPSSCKSDGMCDGSGKCRSYATASTACGSTTCTDGKVTGNVCAGDRAACLVQTVSCGTYACGADACKTSCLGDGDCSASAWCSGSVCVPKASLGTTCSEARECSSNFCIDGVCCNSGCTGQCESCSEPLTKGACTTVTGTPRGARSACAGAGTACAGRCDGINGGSCSSDTTKVCASTCAGGSRTQSLCTTTGSCVAGTPSSCGGYRCDAAGTTCRSSCSTDADCTVDSYCSTLGTCVPKLTNGAACGEARQCGSGFCTDGVCCNAACTGQCESCSEVASKGTCTAITGAPHTGRAACAGTGTACAGKCDGINGGTCAFDTTKVCATACADGSKTTSRCDATGGCVAGPAVSCGGFRCATETACKNSCTGDGDCTADSYCSGTTCTPKTLNGKSCKEDRECSSSFCADGVCCDTRCSGDCESCAETDFGGTCKPIKGPPRPGHTACKSAPCAGSCNGIIGATCTYKPEGCASSCANNIQTLGKCDAVGACVAGAPAPCPGNFACDGPTKCKTSCTQPSDCQARFACVAGKCVPAAASCSPDGLASVNNDDKRTDCKPFRCDPANFQCRASCTMNGDCAPGNVCQTSDSQCVPEAAAIEDGGGCSCEATPHGAPTGLGWMALLAAMAANTRRRARAAARSDSRTG